MNDENSVRSAYAAIMAGRSLLTTAAIIIAGLPPVKVATEENPARRTTRPAGK